MIHVHYKDDITVEIVIDFLMLDVRGRGGDICAAECLPGEGAGGAS